jgi:ribonuclease HII
MAQASGGKPEDEWVPDFAIERGCAGITCGIDEAGRGPLAGPVVAAAVIIDRWRFSGELRHALDDSKALSRDQRESCYRALWAAASSGVVRLGVGAASRGEIDRINILRATLLAMVRALGALGEQPDIALVDGNIAPPLSCAVRTIVKGDALSFSIAAASVVAKVTRDRIMHRLAARYPGYGWEKNAGYGTAEHGAAIRRLGVTPHHRRSFGPVRLALSGSADFLADVEPGALADQDDPDHSANYSRN